MKQWINPLGAHSGIACFELNLDALPADVGQFQQYLEALDERQLDRLRDGLETEFKKTYAESDNGSNLDKDGIDKLRRLGIQINAVREQFTSRKKEGAVQRAAEADAAKVLALAELNDSLFPTASNPGSEDEEEDEEEGTAAVEGQVVAEDATPQIAAAAFANVFAKEIARAVRKLVPVESVIRGPDLNAHVRGVSLSDIAKQAPTAKVYGAREEAVLVASTDAHGMPRTTGNRLDGIHDLVKLMAARARMLQVTNDARNANYVPIASLQRDFRYRLTMDSTPEEIDEVLTAATDVSALVAAGGWCAPSEISYDFYNLVCEDGLVDLPAVGVLNRGGFRYPTSATIADIFGAAGALWSWNETQDIAAATGTGQSGTKTCVRVPCPSFNEVRAACDGLCVTVGNLVDFSYPELVANHIRLVMAARAHKTNQSILATLEAGSTAVTFGGAAGEGAVAEILQAIDQQAYDYRERYRMCEDAVLEATFPRWILGGIRSDLANRSGVSDLFSVTSGQIADWFNSRNVRAQFVADWQSGFTTDTIGHPTVNATDFPATAKFLLYAPGTFVRGQGLQLDLGVVRDSTLNATNDHTAAWMEDCYAVAKVGHESRVVTVDTRYAGAAGKLLT